MPLVTIFAKHAMKKAVPLPALQSSMCSIWGNAPNVVKVMLLRVEDWTSESYDEDCYVSIRAKQTPERTREVVLESMRKVQSAFAEHDLVANVRLETYEGPNYFHVPPTEA